MNPLLSLIVAAAEEEEIAGPGGGFGIGSLALILAIIALLLWTGYLVVNSRRSRDATAERLPPNQTPYMSDDELENVRTTKVLGASVVAAALLAIILPWYAFNESDRAAEATVELEHLDIEEGEKWFVQFECLRVPRRGPGWRHYRVHRAPQRRRHVVAGPVAQRHPVPL